MARDRLPDHSDDSDDVAGSPQLRTTGTPLHRVVQRETNGGGDDAATSLAKGATARETERLAAELPADGLVERAGPDEGSEQLPGVTDIRGGTGGDALAGLRTSVFDAAAADAEDGSPAFGRGHIAQDAGGSSGSGASGDRSLVGSGMLGVPVIYDESEGVQAGPAGSGYTDHLPGFVQDVIHDVAGAHASNAAQADAVSEDAAPADTGQPAGTAPSSAPEGDGTTSINNDDGSTTTVYDTGEIVTAWPDGTVEIDHPDGTVETTYPDGTHVEEYADGSTSTVHPDGTVTETPPPEDTDGEDGDGTTDEAPEGDDSDTDDTDDTGGADTEGAGTEGSGDGTPEGGDEATGTESVPGEEYDELPPELQGSIDEQLQGLRDLKGGSGDGGDIDFGDDVGFGSGISGPVPDRKGELLGGDTRGEVVAPRPGGLPSDGARPGGDGGFTDPTHDADLAPQTSGPEERQTGGQIEAAFPDRDGEDDVDDDASEATVIDLTRFDAIAGPVDRHELPDLDLDLAED